jgi:osmotically-inducible protein OsmY
MNDLEIRQSVEDELEYDPSIDAAHIGVACDHGVVVLSGHVKSYAEKTAAMSAARRVYGVRAIADEIQVKLEGQPKTSDNEIAKRAADILAWHALVPGQKISVTVRDGFITLSGEVEWQYQQTEAEEAVRKLSHITGVANLIEVRPKVPGADIKSRIECALRRNVEVEAHNIRVSVDGGTVTLQGQIDSWAERSAVISAAWSVPGVRRVQTDLVFA